MNIKLSFSAMKPRIIHFNGVPDSKGQYEIRELKKLAPIDLRIPENCCIFSVCSYGYGVLSKQMELNKNLIVKNISQDQWSLKGYMNKLYELNEFLKTNSKFKRVLFVDAQDVFFLRPLERLFISDIKYVMFGAELTYFCRHQDVAKQAKDYILETCGSSGSLMKYLNSGVFIGNRESLIELTDLVIKDYEEIKLICDQSNYIYSIYKNKLPIALDHECKFILNTCRANHLYEMN